MLVDQINPSRKKMRPQSGAEESDAKLKLPHVELNETEAKQSKRLRHGNFLDTFRSTYTRETLNEFVASLEPTVNKIKTSIARKIDRTKSVALNVDDDEGEGKENRKKGSMESIDDVASEAEDSEDEEEEQEKKEEREKEPQSERLNLFRRRAKLLKEKRENEEVYVNLLYNETANRMFEKQALASDETSTRGSYDPFSYDTSCICSIL